MKCSVQWIQTEDKIAQEFPGYVAEKYPRKLTMNLQFTDKKDHCFNRNRKKALNMAKFKLVQKLFKQFNELDHYKVAAKHLRDFKHCKWLENDLWMRDEEFGRQILNGINPGAIAKCTNLPNNFRIKESQVMGLLTRNKTLAEEILEGNIYIINHKILSGVATGTFPIGAKDGIHLALASPMCLLYHDTNGELRPIAIQLEQHNEEAGDESDTITESIPIWTPNDNKLDWLFAKMWFRHADYQVHQMKYHLAFTHLLVEPIAVATFRCLPPAHPLFKLLREHLQFVIAINVYGRDALIGLVSVSGFFVITFVLCFENTQWLLKNSLHSKTNLHVNAMILHE